MPIFGSVIGFGYGRWQNTNGALGRAQWGTIVESSYTSVDAHQLIRGLTCDASNNVYITGNSLEANGVFNYLFDASGNTQVQGNVFYRGIGFYNRIFIGKYNQNGIAQAVAMIGIQGSAENPGQFGYDIKSDSSNNLYVIGTTVVANPNFYDSSGNTIVTTSPFNANNITYTTTNRTAIFAKLNSNLKFQWVTGLQGTTNVNSTEGVCCTVDSSDNVYFFGTYNITGTGTFNIQDASGNRQSNSLYTLPQTNNIVWQYLIKHNSDGKAQWSVYSPASFQNVTTGGVVTDRANNVYMAISYNSTINIMDASGFSQTNSPLQQISTINNTNGAALIKYNSDGKAQWCVTLDTSSGDESRSVVVDSKSNVYWVGTYRSNIGTIYVRDASGDTQSNSLITLGNTASSTDSSLFLIKYNPDGKAQWATRCDQVSGADIGYRACVDKYDNIYIPGASVAGIRFTMYNVSGNTQVPSAVGFNAIGTNNAAFFLKYNSNGIAQWASYITSAGDDVAYTCGTDSENSLYLGGGFSNTSVASIYNAMGNSQSLSPITLTALHTNNSCGMLVKYR